MFELPPLPYAYDALEPVIDAETMKLHHDKHHQAYVDKLNKALEGQADLADKEVDELISNLDSLPKELQTPVRNHGGGHANHLFFWDSMQPVQAGENKPTGKLAEAINEFYGLVGDLQAAFAEAAAGQFGSGWAWLIQNDSGELEITTTANQDSPLMRGVVAKPGDPLLAIDVWEHAYYLQYQNRRAEYIEQWWQVVNWTKVNERYEQVLNKKA